MKLLLYVLTVDTYDKGTVTYICGSKERALQEAKKYDMKDHEVRRLDKFRITHFGDEDRPGTMTIELQEVLQ